MLNRLKTVPKILGAVHLPEVTRRRSMIGKQVMLKLPELQPGYALEIEFSDFDDLKIGRKQILQSCGVVYGFGRVKTASESNRLFVWILPGEIEFAAKVVKHRFGNMAEVENDRQ